MHVGSHDDNGSFVLVDSPALVSPAVARCDRIQFGIHESSLVVPAKTFSIELASHRLRQIFKENWKLIGRFGRVTDCDQLYQRLWVPSIVDKVIWVLASNLLSSGRPTEWNSRARVIRTFIREGHGQFPAHVPSVLDACVGTKSDLWRVGVNRITSEQDTSCCVLRARGDSLSDLEHALSDSLDLIQCYFASIESFGGIALAVRVDLVVSISPRDHFRARYVPHRFFRRSFHLDPNLAPYPTVRTITAQNILGLHSFDLALESVATVGIRFPVFAHEIAGGQAARASRAGGPDRSIGFL
ncbi:hypothetical protein HG530_007027 [Fusarium avenaceum]|nr:hypothetical protein HG530_007027 [Fusarium avenaceum]